MQSLAFVLLACTSAYAQVAEKTFTHGTVKHIDGVEAMPNTWVAMIGDLCQLSNVPRPYPNNTRMYIECVRHKEFEATNANVGIWTINECIPGHMFSPIDSHCAPARRVRRAQQNLCSANPAACAAPTYAVTQLQVTAQPCPCQTAVASTCMCSGPQVMQPLPVAPAPSCGCQTQPSCPCAPAYTILLRINTPCPCAVVNICPCPAPVVVQPMPCPQAQGTGGIGAQENGICSWMLDPLAAHPQKRNCFLQCQPAPYNVFCGRWRSMPCSIYTVFDVQLQVCVNDPAAPVGPLGPVMPQMPIVVPVAPVPVAPNCGCTVGVNIGTCGGNYQCPGMSQCQVSQPAIQVSCSTCCYFGAIFRK